MWSSESSESGSGSGRPKRSESTIAEDLLQVMHSSEFSEEDLRNKSSFAHIPIDAAIARVDNGSVLMDEMSKIFQARLDVEDREIGFSIRVSRPNLYELEIPTSTAEKSLGYLKNYYLFVSREQAAYRRNLDEDLLAGLEESRLKRLNQVTEHKNNIEEISKAAATASSNLVKAKQSYAKVLGEVETVRQKLSAAEANLRAIQNMTESERKKKKEEENRYTVGRFLSAFDRTPEDECKHQSKKLKKLEAELVLKRQDIEEKKSLLLQKIEQKESFYAQAAVAFEKAERDRLQQTQKALKQYCDIEKQALEARIRLLNSFEEGAVANLNSEADVELFANKARDVENTRMFSNAIKLMEWDYKNRVGTENSDDTPSSSYSIAKNATVWADVEGEGEEMTPVHSKPNEQSEKLSLFSSSGGDDREVVDEEVSRLIEEHFEKKPSLEYLLSKLMSHEKSRDKQSKTSESEPSANSSDVEDSESGSKSNKSEDTKELPEETNEDEGKLDDSKDNEAEEKPEKDEEKPKNDMEKPAKEKPRQVEEEKDSDSSEQDETRPLLCVSIMKDVMFGESNSGSSNDEEESSTWTDSENKKESGDGHCLSKKKKDIRNLSIVAFSSETGRNAFLQLLDEKRGRFSTLNPESFQLMTVAMKCFLDSCVFPRRVRAALRLANMSITFHKVAEEEEEGKHYIQREADINQHELWHTAGFWDDALSNGLCEQISMMEPVQWDELDSATLREKVIAIQNILFGQLGTLAFTMHEMGLEKSFVQNLIMNLGKASQLGADLQIELLKSINLSFGECVDKKGQNIEARNKEESSEAEQDEPTGLRNERFNSEDFDIFDKSRQSQTGVKDLL